MKNLSRFCSIPKCSTSRPYLLKPSTSSSRIFSSSRSIEDLRSQLEKAIKVEDYDLASVLRDQINQAELEDPLLTLQKQLAKAIHDERYEVAAKLRDQIAELLPLPRTPLTRATKTTEGVKVSVSSIFVPAQSRPDVGSYFFAYEITITNESHPTTIKLVSREWLITDADGTERTVKGPGVVGNTPILSKGESFTYQSACPLPTSSGTMQGKYEMYSRPSDSGNWCASFMVDIPLFELDENGPTSFS